MAASASASAAPSAPSEGTGQDLIRIGAVSISKQEWSRMILPAMAMWAFSQAIDGKGEALCPV